MNYIPCPYCQSPVLNDGTLAGQVVACPHCRGQMQMPSVPISYSQPVHPTVFCMKCGYQMIDDGTLSGQLVMCPQCHNQMQMPGQPSEFSFESTSPTRRNHRSNNGSNEGISVWQAIGGLCFVFLLLVYASTKYTNISKSEAYKDGYRLGITLGQQYRNEGSERTLNIEGTAELTQMREKKYQIGTSQYGDYVEGLRDGYRNGYFKTTIY